MKHTFETKAWLSGWSTVTPEQLRTVEGAASLHYSPADLSGADFTQIGTATITVELVSERDMVDGKVASLREQAANIRAEATAKCTRIESQIQQLLCIENSSAEIEASHG